jgi:hypothetical protein
VVCDCNRETTKKVEKSMEHSNLGVVQPHCKPSAAAIVVSNLLPWASELLYELRQGPVRMKRWKARDFQRALFGPKGLRDVPPGVGMRSFQLPGGETLRFDYEPTRSPEEMAQIRAEIARFGEPFCYDELPTARYVTVTLLPSAEAVTLPPELVA